MINNDLIYSPIIISSVGIRNTFFKLIDKSINNKIVNRYYNILCNIKPSTTFIYLFVNLEGNPNELGLKSRNLWIWPDKDYDRMIRNFESDPFNAPIPLFIACSCMKDTNWSNKYPGKSNAIILTTGKYEWFKEWENERCMHRSQEYKDFKEKIAQRMLNEGLYKYYPSTKDKVIDYEVGTPLTNNFYLGSYFGEAYGLDSNNYRYRNAFELRPETGIPGLYLSGQDICTLGFTGALMSGVLCAHSVLGYGTPKDIISKRNLIDDISNI